MSISQIAAILVREPFRCSMDEIARMSDYQLQNVFFRMQDPDVEPEKGYHPAPMKRLRKRGEPEEEPRPLSYQDAFFLHFRNSGMSEADIQARWNKEFGGGG